MYLTHGSLFSGIGGFDLAAEWMEWENLFHCEKNPFGRRVLKHYWPHAKSYEDIFTTDFTIWKGRIDVLSGGFPCQPFSVAGERKGTEDERFLWPQMLRAIREGEPAFALPENVPGLLTIGGGVVFEQVCTDLENEGFEVRTFQVPACAKGADHIRERIWIFAYSQRNHDKRKVRRSVEQAERLQEQHRKNDSSGGEFGGAISITEQRRHFDQHVHSNSNGDGQRGRGFGKNTGTQGQAESEENKRERIRAFSSGNSSDDSNSFSKRSQGSREESNSSGSNGLFHREDSGRKENWIEAAARLCSMDDGLSGRLDRITVSGKKRERILEGKQAAGYLRTQSLMAYGNAIYPPIAYEFFKAIEAYEIENLS